MRKTTFIINDNEYFKRLYTERDNATEEQINEILAICGEPFRAVYTLIGPDNSKIPDRYELTTPDGEKIDLNTLNGYQRGVVLNECCCYFQGNRDFEFSGVPCGVVEIKEG